MYFITFSIQFILLLISFNLFQYFIDITFNFFFFKFCFLYFLYHFIHLFMFINYTQRQFFYLYSLLRYSYFCKIKIIHSLIFLSLFFNIFYIMNLLLLMHT